MFTRYTYDREHRNHEQISKYQPLLCWAGSGKQDVGEACTYSEYDCLPRASCIPSWGEGDHGTCQCERFFGFSGPCCAEVSGEGYMLLTLSVISGVVGLYLLGSNLHFGLHLHRGKFLRRDSIGTTLLFSTAFLVPIFGLNVGCALTIVGVDEQLIYNQYWRWPLIVIMQVLFMCMTLSVSFVWIDMVNRTSLQQQLPSPDSSGAVVAIGRGSKFLGARSLQAKVLLVSSISGLATLVAFVALKGDATFISVVGIACILSAGASFSYAGNRTHRALLSATSPAPLSANRGRSVSAPLRVGANGTLLSSLAEVPSPAGEGGAGRIADHIICTSRGIGRCCLSLSTFALLYGFTRPSTRPLYRAQNDLPPYLSGQIPYFMVSRLPSSCTVTFTSTTSEVSHLPVRLLCSKSVLDVCELHQLVRGIIPALLDGASQR